MTPILTFSHIKYLCSWLKAQEQSKVNLIGPFDVAILTIFPDLRPFRVLVRFKILLLLHLFQSSFLHWKLTCCTQKSKSPGNVEGWFICISLLMELYLKQVDTISDWSVKGIMFYFVIHNVRFHSPVFIRIFNLFIKTSSGSTGRFLYLVEVENRMYRLKQNYNKVQWKYT